MINTNQCPRCDNLFNDHEEGYYCVICNAVYDTMSNIFKIPNCGKPDYYLYFRLDSKECNYGTLWDILTDQHIKLPMLSFNISIVKFKTLLAFS